VNLLHASAAATSNDAVIRSRKSPGIASSPAPMCHPATQYHLREEWNSRLSQSADRSNRTPPRLSLNDASYRVRTRQPPTFAIAKYTCIPTSSALLTLVLAQTGGSCWDGRALYYSRYWTAEV